MKFLENQLEGEFTISSKDNNLYHVYHLDLIIKNGIFVEPPIKADCYVKIEGNVKVGQIVKGKLNFHSSLALEKGFPTLTIEKIIREPLHGGDINNY